MLNKYDKYLHNYYKIHIMELYTKDDCDFLKNIQFYIKNFLTYLV